MTFDVATLMAAPVREEVKYRGVRVRTTATIAAARIPIQVDIGFGDAVTPAPVEINYPVLLDAPGPHLRAYPVETVVPEKFEALVTLGTANSRLKDFYDLWLIAGTFDPGRSVLETAVRNTFDRRQTALPGETPIGLSDAHVETWAHQWRTLLGRERMAAAPQGLAMVVGDLRRFLLPLTETIDGDWRWAPKAGWVRSSSVLGSI